MKPPSSRSKCVGCGAVIYHSSFENEFLATLYDIQPIARSAGTFCLVRSLMGDRSTKSTAPRPLKGPSVQLSQSTVPTGIEDAPIPLFPHSFSKTECYIYTAIHRPKHFGSEGGGSMYL
jgi:hypothetical protein